VEQKVIDRLAKGITVGGVEYGPIKVTPIEKRRSEEETSTNEWVYVSLTEGKNREIRRVFEHFKLVVTRLIRVQYGYSGSPLSEPLTTLLTAICIR
jgi:23S rRNA pseudouridine2605 synthase